MTSAKADDFGCRGTLSLVLPGVFAQEKKGWEEKWDWQLFQTKKRNGTLTGNSFLAVCA